MNTSVIGVRITCISRVLGACGVGREGQMDGAIVP